jgi:type II secretory pathway component PulF
MMIMIVPKLLDIFDDKSTLPASTKLLISMSDFFRYYWFFIIIFFIIIYVTVSIWKKTPD